MRNIIIVIVSILVMVGCYFLIFFRDSKVEVSFLQCVDGDTAWFMLNGKREKVRFLAIDTPEISHDSGGVSDFYGTEALEYTCRMLKNAHHIYLEYDNNSKRYDSYQRMLAWVWVDDELLQDKLVLNGYAYVRYVYDDYRYVLSLCESERKAYEKKIGVWNTNTYLDFYKVCN